jgi:hypothetical protein
LTASKPIRWEALMRMSEDELRGLCPFGVESAGVKNEKDRSDNWIPSGAPRPSKLGYRTLKELLRERKARHEEPQWLKATSPPDYTDRRDKAMHDPHLRIGRDVHNAGRGAARAAEDSCAVDRPALASAFNTLYDAHEVAISVLDKEQRGPASSKQEDRTASDGFVLQVLREALAVRPHRARETIEDVAKRMLKRVKELPS